MTNDQLDAKKAELIEALQNLTDYVSLSLIFGQDDGVAEMMLFRCQRGKELADRDYTDLLRFSES